MQAARDLTGGIGVDYAFETAGRAALVQTGLGAARNGGTVVCVGAPPIAESIVIPLAAGFVISEKKLLGCTLGSCNSIREIPRLVALWRAGRLDLEALITARRPLAEINQAMADLRATPRHPHRARDLKLLRSARDRARPARGAGERSTRPALLTRQEESLR